MLLMKLFHHTLFYYLFFYCIILFIWLDILQNYCFIKLTLYQLWNFSSNLYFQRCNSKFVAPKVVVPWCSDSTAGCYYSNPDRFPPRRVGKSRWWGFLMMVPNGNTTFDCSQVSHPIKTSYHHHHHHHYVTLKH